ncbi:hypothetical protein CPB84DRAFT_1790889 [Gymnopilus junonius]|uniref:Uncharacterized protein n=1 Tax=Gymnopilus junonius TaxID=109634 RepID=A0A9P5TIR8_GYMJU|nr:hypothetical protein CPB84DRAFT_1790889 [Gymnopilus junonius]
MFNRHRRRSCLSVPGRALLIGVGGLSISATTILTRPWFITLMFNHNWRLSGHCMVPGRTLLVGVGATRWTRTRSSSVSTKGSSSLLSVWCPSRHRNGGWDWGEVGHDLQEPEGRGLLHRLVMQTIWIFPGIQSRCPSIPAFTIPRESRNGWSEAIHGWVMSETSREKNKS